jgi:hypothetical protein
MDEKDSDADGDGVIDKGKCDSDKDGVIDSAGILNVFY